MVVAEPITVVRGLFESFERERSIEAILDFLAPDIEWSDMVVTKSTLHGHDGFLEAMARLAREGYETESRPEGFEELGEHGVVARGVTRLTTTTSFTDLPAYWAFDVRAGKIVKGATSTRRADALAAIGRS